MAKLKFKLSYVLGLVFPFASFNAIADEPKTAGSEEEAAKEASGQLSAGAIAAAVAAVLAPAEPLQPVRAAAFRRLLPA